MLMFTLAISCLTTFNLPWFMDPTFQVPVQYCSLGHWTLLSPPDTSTTECCFHFGSPSSLFLELYLCSPLVAYRASTDLVGGGGPHLSLSYLFAFMLLMGFSWQEYWSGLPFPSPEDHILSEPSTMTHLSWVALHGMAHNSIELHKAVIQVLTLVSCLWVWFSFWRPLDCSFCFCLPSVGWW